MTEPSVQAAKILGPLSGTSTVWSLDLGLRLGNFDYLTDRESGQVVLNPVKDRSVRLGHDDQVLVVGLRASAAAS